jgi:hypothetical protein
MLKAFDHAIAGAVDAVADEMKDAANIIREQGVVRAVGGAVAQAVEQGLCCTYTTVVEEGEPGGGAASSSAAAASSALPRPPPGNFGTAGKEISSHVPVPFPAKSMGFDDIDAALLEMGAAAKLGLPELPSKGSALHGLGRCKPCAFVLRGACKDGVECSFCHLCKSGEKKRRRKAWKNNQRELQESSPPGSEPTSAAFDGQPFRGYCARLVKEEEASCEGCEPAPEGCEPAPEPAPTCTDEESQQSQD